MKEEFRTSSRFPHRESARGKLGENRHLLTRDENDPHLITPKPGSGLTGLWTCEHMSIDASKLQEPEELTLKYTRDRKNYKALFALLKVHEVVEVFCSTDPTIVVQSSVSMWGGGYETRARWWWSPRTSVVLGVGGIKRIMDGSSAGVVRRAGD